MKKMSIDKVLKLEADKAVKLIHSELEKKDNYLDCGPSDEPSFIPTMGSYAVEALNRILEEGVSEYVSINLGCGVYAVIINIDREQYSCEVESSISSFEFAGELATMLRVGKNANIFIQGSTLDIRSVAQVFYKKNEVAQEEIDRVHHLLRNESIEALVGLALRHKD